jgi:ketosteroid isomerase-like protein
MTMATREPKAVVEELFRRLSEGDDGAIDELMAADMVNHAAAARPGAEGWKQILAIVEVDFGGRPIVEHHQLFGEGDLVAHHMTMRGVHRASTMPLLSGVEVTGVEIEWTYMHVWRVVEHWACRDDLGLLRQVGAWPPRLTAER